MNELKEFDKRESLRVVTKNELITAAGLAELSVNARKLLYLAIAQCKKNDNELYIYKTTPSEIAEIYGITRSAVYRAVDSMTDELMKTIITVRSKDGKTFDKRHLCERCKYTEDKELEIQLHKDMTDMLLNVNGDFSKPLMWDFMRMKSKYSIAIWHLLQREMHSFKPMMDAPIEFDISLDELREVTDTKDKLKKLSEFKAKALDKAMTEIGENCFVKISYTDLKKSKRVVGFRFYVENYFGTIKVEELTLRQRQKYRRAQLVRKRADGTITPAEFDELAKLNLMLEQMSLEDYIETN